MPRRLQLSPFRFVPAAILLALAVLTAAMAARRQSPGVIRGFLPSRVAAERTLEQKLQSIPDPAHAEADLRHLTAEPHMAGTEASHRVALWLRAQYRSFGLDADIVSYSVWLPLPREIRLELVAPDKAVLGTREQPFAGDPDSSDPRAVAGFNSYSPSADVTAPVVYVNYGTEQDYADLESLGVSVAGKIVLVRYGRDYRGVKARIAEEHKAAGLLIYSDPQDDGYVVGDTYPLGPWRPLSAIQRGSVLYTQIYPGDPLTPGIPSVPASKRIAPADAASLPHIPTLPINAQDASVILSHLGGDHVPREWQGGLPLTYHLGPGDAQLHLKLVMDYQQRPIYDVIARLRGANDNEWVIVGNHHDAWVFGAADPGSGTASLLEAARALGNLARSGWKPRRTIVICNWDAEEPGLVGSTEWVDGNLAALQQKAVAYINTDVGVTGSNFSASATPSLDQLVRDVARDTKDPASGRSIFDLWRERLTHPRATGEIPESDGGSDALVELPLGALGAGSDFCPFFDHAGIPAIDVSFTGDYGVYHSLYDDFYWMKHFGDPTFEYHAALARVLGTLALRFDEADILPFNYPEYAVEIGRAGDDLAARATLAKVTGEGAQTVSEASAVFTASAQRAAQALRSMSPDALDAAKEDAINRALVTVEQQFLDPRGLSGRPWYQHTVFAPGTYAGYAAEVMPGLSEALDGDDPAMFQREAGSLAAALRRAAARLDDVTRLAGAAAPPAPSSPR
ncbi:MAG TPA: M28 family metallopeptidase [Candidatus Limnocylindrales bacterium]|nr:M28 family metallopeptidase [Candidatus Limnocylindrales bacterium]